MKTTEKQIAANRRNSTLSTGPVTEAGKASAARNALKHGLLAQEIIIDDGEGAESREQFDALLRELKDQLDPRGLLEEILLEKIAVAYWRLRRAHRYEVGLIRQKLDNASDEYYRPRVDLDPFSEREPNKRDEQIDADIRQVQEQCRISQDQREQITRLRQDGKDLQETYTCDTYWEPLLDELEIEADVSDYSPARVRKALHAAGWTDDAIWQALLEVCTEQIEGQTRAIENLQKKKRDHALALHVQKKLGCLPCDDDLNRLLKYEGSIERQFYKALNELERLQRLRGGDSVPAPVNINLALNPGEGG